MHVCAWMHPCLMRGLQPPPLPILFSKAISGKWSTYLNSRAIIGPLLPESTHAWSRHKHRRRSTHTHDRTYTCTHIHKHTHAHAYTFTHIHTYTNGRLLKQHAIIGPLLPESTHAWSRHKHRRRSTHTHDRTYTCTHIHKYTRTLIHTCTQKYCHIAFPSHAPERPQRACPLAY